MSARGVNVAPFSAHLHAGPWKCRPPPAIFGRPCAMRQERKERTREDGVLLPRFHVEAAAPPPRTRLRVAKFFQQPVPRVSCCGGTRRRFFICSSSIGRSALVLQHRDLDDGIVLCKILSAEELRYGVIVVVVSKQLLLDKRVMVGTGEDGGTRVQMLIEMDCDTTAFCCPRERRADAIFSASQSSYRVRRSVTCSASATAFRLSSSSSRVDPVGALQRTPLGC